MLIEHFKYMQKVLFFNTKSLEKEEFRPITEGEVGMYTCGPTVYDYSHIGNMRAYVTADILKRILLQDYKVRHVINITDVGHLMTDEDNGEDKMEVAAKREGVDAWALSRKFTEIFWKDFSDLGCLPPEERPKATDHISEQIELIKKLEKKGYTYQIADGVYFDTRAFPRYKDFGRLPNEEKGKARVEENPKKRNQSDFALWKFSQKEEKRQMEWESPWGVGFPGWHIECSAMAMKYLGNHFDIHTGGVDHIRVHHTNEIAQSEAATEEIFVNYWVHTEFLLVEGKKMSKSLGNIVTLSDIKQKGYSSADLRALFLMTHYRTQMNFTWEALSGAKAALSSLLSRLAGEEVKQDDEIDMKTLEEFLSLLNDDINTPQAFAHLLSFVKKKEKGEGRLATVAIMGEFLGLDIITLLNEQKKEREEAPEEVMKLIEEREGLRKKKDWGAADMMREKIEAMGYEVSDTEEGPRIQKK